jgi:hypothetical protein
MSTTTSSPTLGCPTAADYDFNDVDCKDETLFGYDAAKSCWSGTGKTAALSREVGCYLVDGTTQAAKKQADSSACVAADTVPVYNLATGTLPATIAALPTAPCPKAGSNLPVTAACKYGDAAPSGDAAVVVAARGTGSELQPCGGCKTCPAPPPAATTFWGVQGWSGAKTSTKSTPQSSKAGVEYSCINSGPWPSTTSVASGDFSCQNSDNQFDDKHSCFKSTSLDLSQSGFVYTRGAGACYDVQGSTVKANTATDACKGKAILQVTSWTKDKTPLPQITQAAVDAAADCSSSDVAGGTTTCKFKDTFGSSVITKANCSACMPICSTGDMCGCKAFPCGSTSGANPSFMMPRYTYNSATPSANPLSTLTHNNDDTTCATFLGDKVYLFPAQRGYKFEVGKTPSNLTGKAQTSSAWKWVTDQGGGTNSWEGTCNAFCQQSNALCESRVRSQTCDGSYGCKWDTDKGQCGGSCGCVTTVNGAISKGQYVQRPYKNM